MGILYVLGDESGNIPLSDSDKPFVTALVASRSEVRAPELSSESNRSRSVNWIVKQIADKDLLPFIAYVKPSEGYEQAVSEKFDKMDTMARYRKLMTGTHDYLPTKGMRPRNLIWLIAMTQAIAEVTFTSIRANPVTEVRGVLHQRTLASQTEKMFRDGLGDVGPQIRQSLQKYRDRAPTVIDTYLANHKLDRRSVDLKWASECDEPALWIPHHLGRLALSALVDPSRKSVFQVLRNRGYKQSQIDLTPLITSPINDEAIDVWKRDTGLPEPKVGF